MDAVVMLSDGGHSISNGSKELSLVVADEDELILGIIIRTPLCFISDQF
jgi:hypothetical protein